jgi:hypothetical protein
MKKNIRLLLAPAALLFAGCAAHKPTSSYYNSPTALIRYDADGSMVLRAYGSGRTGANAREQAWKNAVRDVIFKGINVPGNPMASKPLVTEVNAQEKYEQFFNAFFQDKGYYRSFVTTEDRKPLSSVKEENKLEMKQGTTLRVLRPELKEYLKENGILK